MEARKAKADSLREWKQEKQRQIPFGNDSKKSKSRFPAGMTARKAKADSLRE
jgi:hypothetical protein